MAEFPSVVSGSNIIARPRPRNCEKCPYKSRTIGTKGPIDSPIVIVGESPGTKEIIQNLPFVGPSGEVIHAALKGGVEPFFTNAVSCIPKAKDANNLAAACHACHDRLVSEIASHPREVILAMGNGAVWSLTNDYNLKITQTRGRVIPSPLAKNGIVACVHPAFLLRGGGSSRLFKRDVQLACDLTYGDSPYKYKEVECVLMETESDIRDLIDLASAQEYIAADLETTGFSPRVDYILSHGFCWNTSEAYIVPPHLFHLLGDIYNPSVVSAKYIWHNGKFDVGFLRADFQKSHSDWRSPQLSPYIRHKIATIGNRWGYQFAKTHEDTMLASYSIDENNGIHGLEILGNDLLSAPNWKSVIEQWLPKAGASYANVPPNVLYLYQAKDLGTTWQIFNVIRANVAEDPMLENLYVNHLLPASEFLTAVESNGIEADQEVMAVNDVNIYKDYESALHDFHVLSQDVLGIDVNPNSWQQVQKLLYRGGLDIAGGGKILATDAKTLQPYGLIPAVKKLQACRELRKLHSQYVVSLRDAIEPDGRIHTSFKLTSTTTGRLASSDPVNLQNIVRDDRIKNQFKAKLRHWLLSNDLSQAELRVLAILSGDPALCALFEPGAPSIHKVVAAKFYGTTYTEDQYQLAKAVTFGIVYGRDAFSIAVEYGIPVKEAQAYIDNWFAQFPIAKQFIERCRRAPMQGKILKTPWGRKRRFGIVGPERYHDAGNQAANFPEQSMASDITLEAGYLSNPTLIRWGISVVNIIHDDIMKEVPQNEDLVRSAIELVQRHMREVPIRRGLTRVPFVSEWKIGTHWGGLRKEKELPSDFFQSAY